MTTIIPAVEKAISEIRSSFPESRIDEEPDGAGGAYLVVHGLPLGSPFNQQQVWIGFQITFQYPYADVYPHFTCAELSRADGKGLGQGLGQASFRDKPATQISRRSNKLNPATDTAALKLLKVLQWLKSHQ